MMQKKVYKIGMKPENNIGFSIKPLDNVSKQESRV